MFDKEKRKTFSNEDEKIIRGIHYKLKYRGDKLYLKDGKPERHLFGLKTWLSDNWIYIESFIFAAIRLHEKYWINLRELTKLRKQAEKSFGVHSLVDLNDVFGVGILLGYNQAKNIMIAEKNGEKLKTLIESAIKKAEKKGFKEGSNLLIRLAKGDVSLLEFESN